MYICLAPMDGITDAVYRYIVHDIFRQYNPTHQYLCRTEFVSSDGYIHNWKKLVRHLMTYTTEYHCTIAQIYGGDEDILTQVAQEIDQKYNFSGIELNIGCPSPKVMSCGGGAGMLRDKQKTLSIVKKISDSIHTPFSIKTRIGLGTEDRQEQFDFVMESAQYCQTITIHGRTYRQSHSGSVDRSFVTSLKQELGNRVKIFGNGGIKSYQDIIDHQGILDGIMVGQAAIGNPWILTPYIPTISQRYDTIMLHLQLSCLMELYFQDPQHFDDDTMTLIQPNLDRMLSDKQSLGSNPARNTCHSIVEFRKYLFNYVHGLPGNKELKIQVAQVKEYDTLVDMIKKYFDTLSDATIASL